MFCGWFDIGAARAVTAQGDDGTDVARLVLHLVDRSLITADRDGGAARYRLLETLRVYGLERLESAASWMPPAAGMPAGRRNW